ncbi:MAG TPA: MerR family transcriptional regulator [Thermoanaerobacterales bacterium]|nr:MerR family transcriptional regulator [Thermoanaerobacterales bacterium]
MDLRNCPICGKLFVFMTRNMCPDCIKKEDEEFDLVREYINEHAEATIDEVSEATGIPPSKILKFLKEGRLMISPNNINIVLRCEMCDEPILTGRYCKKCAEEFAKGLKGSAYRGEIKNEPAKQGRMHTIDRYRDKRR